MSTDTLHKKKKWPGRYIHPDDLPNRARTLRIEKCLTLDEVSAQIGIKSKNSLLEFEVTGRGLGVIRRSMLAEVLETDFANLMTPGKNFDPRKNFSEKSTSIA